MQQNRQLAAIMFTDIVGYTAMMQENEQSAVAITKRYVAILKQKAELHGGEILNDYGDGSLCTFSSATQAVRCALEVQQQLQTNPRVPLRIGLHIGEIFFEDGKIFGDGVNIASRIQSIGVANSILFSSEIGSKLANQPEFRMVSLGKFQFKNVSAPVEVFALTNEGLLVPDKGKIEGKLQEKKTNRNRNLFIALALLGLISFLVYRQYSHSAVFTGKEKSIAVLPFENISNDTLQQFFSDGITEDIITQLSKIADLKVISRTSVMQYKNTTKTIRQIAKELGVTAILEGSVRKEGNNIRINAQLIDANTDQHLWADRYDRDASEVFAIQSEVAQRIANQLDVKLTADEGNRIQKKATKNVAAYEDYLKARKLPLRERIPLLLSALKKDSSFALAWADLALMYARSPARNQSEIPYYIRKSLDAALTAVYYGPDLSETHMILGDVLKTITLNPALSLKELKKSIALNPNNSEAYVYLAYTEIELGMFDEAELNLRKAAQLDPMSGVTRGAWFNLYLYSRKPDSLMSFLKQQPVEMREGLIANRKPWYFFLKDDYDSILVDRKRLA
jgi:TolB-like protein